MSHFHNGIDQRRLTEVREVASKNLGYSKVFLHFRRDQTQSHMWDYIFARRGHPFYGVAMGFLGNWYRIEQLAGMFGLMSLKPNPDGDGLVVDIAGIDALSSPVRGGHGLEMIGCSIVIGAWTAFEVLAGDLWIAAVNSRPVSLGKPAAKRQKVGIDAIANHKFDLREHMGDMLRRKARLKSLNGLQKAYSVAFGGDKRIDKALHTPCLHTLSQCRNQLVHDGGLFDQEFIDKVKNVAELRQYPFGSVLHINGDLICKFLRSARKASVGLLFAADRWLSRHPE
jgi:hypothetical protein